MRELLLAALLASSVATAAALAAEPAPDISNWFDSTEGWTGGDAAYSVALSNERTLWLFGDSFIGTIRHGRRTPLDMVHNALALQSLPDGPLQYFWRRPLEAAFQAPHGYYWPGDGCLQDGHLWLFMKHVELADGPPGFNFTWASADVLDIDRPDTPPGSWRPQRSACPGRPETGLLGTACLVDDGQVYVYGQRGTHAILGRTRDHQTWTFWHDGAWVSGVDQATSLFDGAAAEMSVCRVPQRSGFYAVYTRDGLGSDIVMRHADTPWGPWGEAHVVYHCPETGVFIYAAKAHAEFTSAAGRLLLTYCCNLADFPMHAVRPDVYRPRAVWLTLPDSI